ncbi:MAG: low-complexity tail membrane protein, partial [Cyanobacteriota bacterium]|nr:low-complexity tail membrane protein [Cyanobacteriota bacterium]
LWRLPADVWSLLLAQTPALGRRDLQRRLSRLQDSPPLKLLGPALGALALLPLLIRLDQRSALAAPLWTSGPLPRLVALLLAALLLGLMLWQWQQVVQALWMLSRREAILETVQPLSLAELGQKRLSPGIPLLLPPQLTFAGVAEKARGPQAAAKTTARSASVAASVAADAVSSLHGESLPVKPEQGAANPDGDDLDQPVA